MIALINSIRDDNTSIVNFNSVNTDVHILNSVDSDFRVKDQAKTIFYERSFNHIAAMSNQFQSHSEQSIGSFIEKNLNAYFLSIINIAIYSKYPVYYISSVLKKSMKGLGTDEFLLTSCVLLTCETIMAEVKLRFKNDTGKSLRSWIKDDTSGHYKYALYELIGEKRSNR